MIRIFKLTFLIFLFLITKANSLIEIDITRGNLDPVSYTHLRAHET